MVDCVRGLDREFLMYALIATTNSHTHTEKWKRSQVKLRVTLTALLPICASILPIFWSARSLGAYSWLPRHSTGRCFAATSGASLSFSCTTVDLFVAETR